MLQSMASSARASSQIYRSGKKTIPGVVLAVHPNICFRPCRTRTKTHYRFFFSRHWCYIILTSGKGVKNGLKIF